MALPKKLVATSVKIVPVIAEGGADTISVDDVQVFACFTEEFTSVITTTAGATSTEKITTKFTSAGTTVTTVVASTTPSPTTGMLQFGFPSMSQFPNFHFSMATSCARKAQLNQIQVHPTESMDVA